MLNPFLSLVFVLINHIFLLLIIGPARRLVRRLQSSTL
jgi:hypothetical protein